MKNIVTPISCTCLLAVFVISFFGCKEQISEMEVKPALEIEPEQDMVMNDSLWSADSLKVWYLWNRYNKTDEYKQDSCILYCQELIDIGKRMMEYKFDSTIYEKYGKAYGGIGFNLTMKGQLEEGLYYSKKAQKLITEAFTENHIRNTEICVGISDNYWKQGDLKGSINWQKKSLSILYRLFPNGNHHYIGNKLRNISYLYYRLGEYDIAIDYLKKVRHRELTVPEEYNDVTTLTFLANCYLSKGEYIKAIEYIAEADHYVISSMFPVTARINLDLVAGKIFSTMGDEKQALNRYSNVIDQYPKAERQGIQLGEAYFEMGKLAEKKTDYSLARTYFDKSLKVWETALLTSEDHRVTVLSAYAGTFYLENKFEDALNLYQTILHGYSNLFPLNDYKINPPIESLNSNVYLLEALEDKAKTLEVYFDRNKDEELLYASFNSYKLAADISDKMRLGYKWQDSKQSLSQKVMPIFEGALRTERKIFKITQEKFHLYEMFYLNERSKAFTLLENLKWEKVRLFSDISPELHAREEKVNQKIYMYEKLILEEQQNAELLDSTKVLYWYAKLINLKSSQDSIKKILEKNHPSYHQLQYKNKVGKISKIKEGIINNETLIEYFLGDATLYTFVIGHSGLEVFQQKIDSNFFQAIDRLQDLSKHPSSEKNWKDDYQQFVADSRYLYQVLLEPSLSPNSPFTDHHSPLIIIPDGILNFLPFNLLLTEAPDENTVANSDYRSLPYLISNHDIRYEYSATLMVESKRSKPGSFWQKLKKSQPAYCGFAPSYGDGDPIASRGEMDSIKLADLYPGLLRGEMAPLTHNRSEVDTASETLGGMPFIGSAATEKAFKQNAPQAGILHLAMHALTNDKEPLFSQLAFEKDKTDTSNDGRLHAYELYNMRLKADLAVLSACNTGAGKLQRGEGVMSLSRAFKYAGVPNVVMSLWAASDEPTEKIVNRFFKNLKAGMGKDEALCGAQREFVEHASQVESHPYYWSTLMLIGDAEPLYGNGIGWPYYLAGFAFLLLIGLLLKGKSK